MTDRDQKIRVFAEVTEDEVPSIRRVLDRSELEGWTDVDEIAEYMRSRILWGVYGDYGALLKIAELRTIERLDEGDEDAQAFQQLYLKGLREQPSSFGSTYEIESKKTPEDVKAFLKDNYVVGVKHGFVDGSGEHKEKLVAIAQYKRLEGVKSHIATIGKVYVHPAHRKRALAGNIMDHLLYHAIEEGVEQIHLIVTASNEFVVDFYKKLGFVPGQMQYKAAKIDGQYYDWLPMKLSMHDYKSGKHASRPRLP